MKCPKCGSEFKAITLPTNMFNPLAYGKCTKCDYEITTTLNNLNYKVRLEKVLSKFDNDKGKYIYYRNNSDLITYKNNQFEIYIDYINQLVISLETVESLLKDLEALK